MPLRDLVATGLRIAVIGAMLPIAIPAYPEVPPLSDEQLTEHADLIVTGYVESMTERDEVRYPVEMGVEQSAFEKLVEFFGPRPKLVSAIYTVTVNVEQVEKGELPSGEQRIQFTGQCNVVTPKHWMGGTNTMRVSLQPGDGVKVYLERDGDHWRLFHHMGLWMRR